MSTFSGEGGAGALIPASVVAPTLASPRAAAPARAADGARPRAPRAISPGTVVRSSSASPSSLAEPGSGRGLHGGGSVPAHPDRMPSGPARGVEQHGGYVHPGDPVHQRVVGLGDQREAPARHPLDQPDLPQRLGAVQALGEEPPGEPLERRLVARPRQRGVADVVVGLKWGRRSTPGAPGRAARTPGAGGSAARGAGGSARARRAPAVSARGLRRSSPTPRACARWSDPPGAGTRCRGR